MIINPLPLLKSQICIWVWVGKIPWTKKWKPTPVFLRGKSHGQRSLVDYSPWGSQKSRTWLKLTRLPCPWTFPGKNTGVGCHFLSRGSSWPRDQTLVVCIAGRFLTISATRDPKQQHMNDISILEVSHMLNSVGATGLYERKTYKVVQLI